MGRIRTVALLILLTLCFTSCGIRKGISDYRAEAFVAEVDYFKNGEMLFGGEVDVKRENGDGQRDIRITLTSPKAMSGAVLYRENGEIRMRLGEREMSGESFSSIFSGIMLIIPSGELMSVEKRKQSEKNYLRAKFSSGEEIYFDIAAEIPVEIRKGDERLVIRKMNIRATE